MLAFVTVAATVPAFVSGCVPAAKSVNAMSFGVRSTPTTETVASVNKTSEDVEPRIGTRTPPQVIQSSTHLETKLANPERTAEAQRTMPSTTTTSGKVYHVSTANFQQDVLEADVPVLVDFYADWCGPCRMLAPALDQLAKETPHAKVVKINIDKSPQLAAKYKVSSIPTLMVFKDGDISAQHTGMANRKTMEGLLEQ
jgi:thioredoxin 1